MSELVIESFDELTAWAAEDATGAASSELEIEAGGATPVSDGSARVTASADAAGHRLERNVATTNLSPFDDLVIWLRGRNPGASAPNGPAELRLGSATRPPGHAQNPWHRLLPVDTAGQWQALLLGLDGLPTNVRSAVDAVRLTAREGGWALDVGPMLAVRPELLTDVDTALLQRLDRVMELDGDAVPAVIVPAVAPTPPFLRLSHDEVRPAPERARTEQARTDFSDDGFVLRDAPTPFDLGYTIEAVADERADAARMLEFALDALGSPPQLFAGGLPLGGEWVEPDPEGPQPALRLRLAAWRRAPGARRAAIPPFNEVAVEVDQNAL